MKKIKFIFLMAAFLAASMVITSCGNSANSNDQSQEATSTEAAHGEGKEHTSAYVCPMHCEGSGGEEAGKCQVCGMDYIAQAEHTKDGHTH